MKTLLVLLMAAGLTPAADQSEAGVAFAKLKSLIGEWTGDTKMGKARLTYEMTAAGTTLVERESAEKMPEMMTVYHLDGGRLLLTHYCMAGNQPRMEAKGLDASGKELQFRFVNATNLATPATGHMRNVNIRFVDRDHLATEWQFFEDGKLKMTEKGEYTRVK